MKVTWVIDDDKIFTFIIKRLIAVLNISTKTVFFSNGQLAIEHLRTEIDNTDNLPDVILLDLHMPVLNGWQFMDEFITLSVHKRIAVHILSSSVNRRDLQKAKSYKQISDFIIKPVPAQALKSLLKHTL